MKLTRLRNDLETWEPRIGHDAALARRRFNISKYIAVRSGEAGLLLRGIEIINHLRVQKLGVALLVSSIFIATWADARQYPRLGREVLAHVVVSRRLVTSRKASAIAIPRLGGSALRDSWRFDERAHRLGPQR